VVFPNSDVSLSPSESSWFGSDCAGVALLFERRDCRTNFASSSSTNVESRFSVCIRLLLNAPPGFGTGLSRERCEVVGMVSALELGIESD
jgi:hypothetical protein